LTYDDPVVARITSRQHPIVQRCRRLASRREADSVLLDGEHLVADALTAGLAFQAVIADARHATLAGRAAAAGAIVYDATPAVIEAASPVRSPSGIVAIATWRPLDVPAALAKTALAVGLVGVQDPGNTGSVVRSADALGAGAVVLLEGTADAAAWKALRAAMGSTFRIPVARGRLADTVRDARARGMTIAATVPHGGRALGAVDLSPPLFVLFGGEGAGLPPDIVAGADLLLTVPMRQGVESLNIAVTAALVMWEARRQASLGPMR
jgi:RNA methyltransferase, TrmH family